MARIVVRMARPDEGNRAREAAALIAKAAKGADIAKRSSALLREKIEDGRAVLALEDDTLVGFGYFSDWEDGRFVSHSGLVVDERLRGKGLGRRLKERLLRASDRRFPAAATMSLTSNPAVEAMNRSLGFEKVPLSRLTTDEAFWAGCMTCRNYEAVRARGERCCCFGMLRPPSGPRRRRPVAP